jgi:hypothetical protein
MAPVQTAAPVEMHVARFNAVTCNRIRALEPFLLHSNLGTPDLAHSGGGRGKWRDGIRGPLVRHQERGWTVAGPEVMVWLIWSANLKLAGIEERVLNTPPTISRRFLIL